MAIVLKKEMNSLGQEMRTEVLHFGDDSLDDSLEDLPSPAFSFKLREGKNGAETESVQLDRSKQQEVSWDDDDFDDDNVFSKDETRDKKDVLTKRLEELVVDSHAFQARLREGEERRKGKAVIGENSRSETDFPFSRARRLVNQGFRQSGKQRFFAGEKDKRDKNWNFRNHLIRQKKHPR